MQKHISIKVQGKVQGVFFRASTSEKAKGLGLTGFVRNEPDGSVYIEAEGEEVVLVEFTAWCRQGPRLAQVEQLDIKEGKWEGFRDFVISH